MSSSPDPVDEFGSRDRKEHAGLNPHPDDDALARRTERERVDAGLQDAGSQDADDDVPPAAE